MRRMSPRRAVKLRGTGRAGAEGRRERFRRGDIAHRRRRSVRCRLRREFSGRYRPPRARRHRAHCRRGYWRRGNSGSSAPPTATTEMLKPWPAQILDGGARRPGSSMASVAVMTKGNRRAAVGLLQVLEFAQRDRLQLHFVAGGEHRVGMSVLRPQCGGRLADETPATGRFHRMDAGHLAADADGTGGHFVGEGSSQRGSARVSGRSPRIGEARQKAEHIDVIFDAAVQAPPLSAGGMRRLPRPRSGQAPVRDRSRPALASRPVLSTIGRLAIVSSIQSLQCARRSNQRFVVDDERSGSLARFRKCAENLLFAQTLAESDNPFTDALFRCGCRNRQPVR